MGCNEVWDDEGEKSYRMIKTQLKAYMSKGLPQRVKSNLEKCQAAAIAAVDVYNRPGPKFRTAHYIVMIVLAYTAVFHAIFYKRGINPWHKKNGKNSKGDRYLRIDGEPKHWELVECIKHYYGSTNPPERKNLEFLIGLRNKIEHRNLPELDGSLYGECQAALLNLEDLLTKEFGNQYAMAEQLSIALQFTSFLPDEKRKANRILVAKNAKSIKEYVEKFRGSLSSSVLGSTKYSFSVFLVPRLVNKKDFADVAVEFLKIDETNAEELSRLEKLNVLIKEKHIPIANLNMYKPNVVVSRVNEVIPGRLTLNGHSAAWSFYKVRPSAGDSKPEKTDSRYCVFDSANKNYLYTEAWIEKLQRELIDEDNFKKITSKALHK